MRDAFPNRKSILAQERDKAVRDYASQLAMVECDELDHAYESGRWQGRLESHRAKGQWWRIGVICGIALSVLVWSFWT